MTDTDYTAMLVILDRSGSMSSIRDDMVGGIEHLIAAQAAEPGLLTLDAIQGTMAAHSDMLSRRRRGQRGGYTDDERGSAQGDGAA